jgi:hypothetical protein
VISWTLSVLVVAAIAGGLLHALRGFAPVLGLLPMQIHVGAALAAAALLAAHVLPYRHRRRIDLGRRTACAGPWRPWAGWRCGPSPRAGSGATPARTRCPRCPSRSGCSTPCSPSTDGLALRLPGGPLDLDALAALPQTTVAR